MNSLISIIIPTYNRAYLIGETLDSVLAQTYTNWECIIVDDGSTDNSEEVIKEYTKKDHRFQYHHRPDNKQKGPNSCRNYGYQLSKGDYINWFDSDDLFFPEALSVRLNEFDNNTDVVIGKLERINSNTHEKINGNRILSNSIIEDYYTGKISYYVCGPLWNKIFLEKQLILFDEEITNLDDWDFNLRMLYESPKIVYLDEVLIKYRVHENSLSQEINKLNFDEIRTEFRAREKHLKLIQKNKIANSRVLNNFIKDRYKFILREALIQNHNIKGYLFRMLLVEQLKTFDFIGFIKILFGFTIFRLSNKGYILLK